MEGCPNRSIAPGVVRYAYDRSRQIGRIVLPNSRLALIQIGIGVLDLSLGALAMYALLPAEPAIDFFTLQVIFVTAFLLGYASHTPGSLGVIEAAMLIGLPQFQKEELLASLLIFRFLYFVFPLCLRQSCSVCARLG